MDRTGKKIHVWEKNIWQIHANCKFRGKAEKDRSFALNTNICKDIPVSSTCMQEMQTNPTWKIYCPALTD